MSLRIVQSRRASRQQTAFECLREPLLTFSLFDAIVNDTPMEQKFPRVCIVKIQQRKSVVGVLIVLYHTGLKIPSWSSIPRFQENWGQYQRMDSAYHTTSWKQDLGNLDNSPIVTKTSPWLLPLPLSGTKTGLANRPSSWSRGVMECDTIGLKACKRLEQSPRFKETSYRKAQQTVIWNRKWISRQRETWALEREITLQIGRAHVWTPVTL